MANPARRVRKLEFYLRVASGPEPLNFQIAFQQIGDGRHGVDHSTVSGALVMVVDLQVNRARRCLEPLGDFPDACGVG